MDLDKRRERLERSEKRIERTLRWMPVFVIAYFVFGTGVFAFICWAIYRIVMKFT
jgi:hypothetical protein